MGEDQPGTSSRSTPRRNCCWKARGEPFLAGFYQDRRRWPGHAAVFPVPTRQPAVQPEAARFARAPTVADFLFDKDPLFARLNLSDEELLLYQRIYEHLAPQTPTPDLVIYLQAPVETLIARVRRRGAAYEKGISEDYLARLNEAYGRFFYDYTGAPLLIVNSQNLNFVDRPADFELLWRRINEMRGPREFFSLGS